MIEEEANRGGKSEQEGQKAKRDFMSLYRKPFTRTLSVSLAKCTFIKNMLLSFTVQIYSTFAKSFTINSFHY